MVIRDLVTVIAAGETVDVEGGAPIVGFAYASNDFPMTVNLQFINRGTINYTNNSAAIAGGYFRPGQNIEINNAGVINATTPGAGGSGIELQGQGAMRFTNSGQLIVVGERGYSGVGASSSEVMNSGLVQVRAPQYLAYGFEMPGGSFTNSGTIRVFGPAGARAVTMNGNLNDPIQILNTGSIVAEDGDVERASAFGVSVANSVATIINRGEITAEIAIDVYKNPGFTNYRSTLENFGLIQGKVWMGLSPDIVRNAGMIRGVVDLSGGDDVFEGRGGSVGGVVGGGDGDDTLTGGASADSLSGDAGSDILVGGGGDDRLDGGDDFDVVSFAAAGSGVTLDLRIAGPQLISGELGSDSFVAVEKFVGSAFADTMTGGSGDDWFEGGGGADRLEGGAGRDTASYESASGGVRADLAEGTAIEPGGVDSLASIERIVGSAFADSMTGGLGDDDLNGGGGADVISGGAGKNYLRGDDGDDSITGGAGFDDINGNMGNDTCVSGGGDDWVVGGRDNDSLVGSAGQNLVYGNLGADTCEGGDGNDVVRGGQDNDVILGGVGDDYVSGDKGSDTVTGGAGADIFHTFGGAGLDRVLDFSLAQGDRVQVDPGTQYTMSQVGADTVIDMSGGGQMVLVGVQMSTLTPGWIFGA